MAARLKVVGSLERRCNIALSDLDYCPETVLVQCAFLLADKEAGQSLIGAEKGNCRRVVQIVSEAIREVTKEAIQDNTRKLFQVEIKEIEFKIHSWVFTSLLKCYGIFGPGESPEEDYFDSFPPLPQFDIKFYLQLVHEVGWGDLLVEVRTYITMKIKFGKISAQPHTFIIYASLSNSISYTRTSMNRVLVTKCIHNYFMGLCRNLAILTPFVSNAWGISKWGEGGGAEGLNRSAV